MVAEWFSKERRMPVLRLDHVVVYVSNARRTAAFYRDALDVRTVHDMDDGLRHWPGKWTPLMSWSLSPAAIIETDRTLAIRALDLDREAPRFGGDTVGGIGVSTPAQVAPELLDADLPSPTG